MQQQKPVKINNPKHHIQVTPPGIFLGKLSVSLLQIGHIKPRPGIKIGITLVWGIKPKLKKYYLGLVVDRDCYMEEEGHSRLVDWEDNYLEDNYLEGSCLEDNCCWEGSCCWEVNLDLAGC